MQDVLTICPPFAQVEMQQMESRLSQFKEAHEAMIEMYEEELTHLRVQLDTCMQRRAREETERLLVAKKPKVQIRGGKPGTALKKRQGGKVVSATSAGAAKRVSQSSSMERVLAENASLRRELHALEKSLAEEVEKSLAVTFSPHSLGLRGRGGGEILCFCCFFFTVVQVATT